MNKLNVTPAVLIAVMLIIDAGSSWNAPLEPEQPTYVEAMAHLATVHLATMVLLVAVVCGLLLRRRDK